MDSQFKNSKLSVENFRLISYCPMCSKHYNTRQVEVVEESDSYHFVHVVCEHCQGMILALVVTGNTGISSMGIVTDLTKEDAKKFKDNEEISVDDVLKIHTWLSDENFSFKIKINKNLLAKEKNLDNNITVKSEEAA